MYYTFDLPHIFGTLTILHLLQAGDFTQTSKRIYMNNQSLTDLLNAEIEYLLSSKQRSGITHWALLAAIAAISWMLLLNLEEFVPNSKLTAIYFLLFSFFVDGIGYIFSILKPKNYSSGELRYNLTSQFAAQQRSIIFGLLLSIFIISLSAVIILSINLYVAILIFISYGITIILSIFALYMSQNPKPIVINEKWSGKIVKLKPILWVSAAFLVIGYWEIFKILSVNLELTIIKFSISFVVLTYLLKQYYALEASSPLINTLINLRRNLHLENIEIKTAQNEIEIALFGLKTSDLFQKEINSLLEEFDTANLLFVKLNYRLESIENYTGKEKTAILDVIAEETEELSNLIKSVVKKRTHLKDLIEGLSFYSDKVTVEFEPLWDKIKVQEDYYLELEKEFKVKLEEFSQ